MNFCLNHLLCWLSLESDKLNEVEKSVLDSLLLLLLKLKDVVVSSVV